MSIPAGYELDPQAGEPAARLPLSFAQQRLWFLAQMDGVSEAYHIPLGMRLRGNLNSAVLHQALDRILVRHEVLRTTFVRVDGEPEQRIAAPGQSSFLLVEHDLQENDDAQAELDRLSEVEAGHPFDLEAGPLIRGRLIRLGKGDHALLLTMHHIVSDGWSMGVLVSELGLLYSAFLRGQADSLPELEIQYADFAIWQRQWTAGEMLQQQAAYWKTALAGAPPLLELPTDHPRPAQQDFAGASADLSLDEQLTAGLKNLSRKHRTTLFMTLLAAWGTLLSRLSGQQDLVIGTPTANRGRVELENLIGFFVNALALRLDLSGSPITSELLERVRMQVLAAQQHQDIPFEQVVKIVQPTRSLAHSPLFQVVLAWQSDEQTALRLLELEASVLQSPYRTAKYDLTLSLRETGNTIAGGFEYATSLFEPATIERYRGYFYNLLRAMVADQSQAVDRLPMLSESERQRLLYEWNDTEVEFGGGKCLHEMFEAQVEKSPDRTAVVLEDTTLSYGELNRRANQLARLLISEGVGPESIVALALPRCLEMIVSVLGVLKAGAAYLPLDPKYPRERLAFMIRDAQPACLLLMSLLATQLSEKDGKEKMVRLTLDSDVIQDRLAAMNGDNVGDGEQIQPSLVSHAAYVIYTSGSTGTPKAVTVAHVGIANLSAVQVDRFAVTSEARVLQFASPSFDASAWEIIMALTTGAALVMAGGEERDGPPLQQVLLDHRVTHALLPPPVLATLQDCAELSLKHLMVGGEACPAELAGQWCEGRSLVNAYGPTEATVVVAMSADLSGTAVPPIGRAIWNTQLYVLDRGLQPVATGVAGELYAAGIGLARGYLRRPELTGERFVPDPYARAIGARMYKTGDLARWGRDGEIEFLGRNDSQVKLRGFRIELGEIEAVLRRNKEVAHAVVVAREDTPGWKQLIGYVVAGGGQQIDGGALRREVAEQLPEYMVPAAVVVLKELPLNASGKVDRKALPVPDFPSVGSRAPRTPEEEILAGLFAEVLHLEGVGIDDNFFENGGHSLLATRLISRIRSTLGIEVGIRSLFESPTVASLGQRLAGGQRARPPLRRRSRPERIPLSFAQKRLWFLQQLEGAGATYNLPLTLRLEGGLNRKALRQALGDLLIRHEILRTVFCEDSEGPWQRVLEEQEVPEFFLEQEIAGEQLEGALKQAAGYKFDLQREIPLRVWLLRLEEQQHVLVLLFHHIATDGWSMAPAGRDLAAAYNARCQGEAPRWSPLPVQYVDYSLWQAESLGEESDGQSNVSRQLEYWKENLAGLPPEMEQARDRVRPAVSSYRGENVYFQLSASLHEKLVELAGRHGATLFMVLQAGLAVVMTRQGAGGDIVIGSPVAGRTDDALDDLVGFFVNTLVLRTDTSDNPSFKEVLARVRENDLNAYAHQELPFEHLVEVLNPERSLNRHPLFQVMLVLQNNVRAKLEMKGLHVKTESSGASLAKFDLTVTMREERGGGKPQGIQAQINYAMDLFERGTVEKLGERLERVLQAVAENPEQGIGEIEILGGEERQRLLYEWNDTEVGFEGGKCLHEMFEAQAEKSPDRVAVVVENTTLSYGELNQQANRLGHYLRQLGVKPETRVGLLVERSLDMVVGLLGVLKAGAAYVPLDPGSPRERLKYMIEDSGARLVLSNRNLSSMIREVAGLEVLLMEAEEWHHYNSEAPQVSIEPAQLAYVIYTSGSTGRPKGVGVEHRQLVNYVHAVRQKLQIEPGMRLALVSTYAADLGYTMIFPALCYGGCLNVVDAGWVLDAGKLEEHFTRHPADYLKIVPSHLRALLNSSTGSGILPKRWLILGGEAASWDFIQQVKERGAGCRVLNHYGPTETTVGVLTYDTTQDDGAQQARGMVPVGRPLSNGKAYVLDDELNPVGVGVGGEIYIGGAGVARGYLNRPELTAEKFLANPYSGESGGRMYRTGDLGRYLASGDIEFLGRKDHQVKVRGFRIELGEVETALMSHPKVREVIVVAREDSPGDKKLVAYVVAKTGDEDPGEENDSGSSKAGLGISELREHLQSKLPEYMVPSAFVQLEKLPLNHNGKIDRESLPQPDKDTPEQEYVEPRNPTEETLCRLWQEILRRDRVGIHDNFFKIGGHSLLAVQLISRIKSAFAVEMPLSVLFAAPTVARMAEHITAVNEHERPQSSPVLVSIQPHGSRAPFFCVHAIGGQVFSYAELSQELGLEQPFYGLQSPPANFFLESGISIEQLATLYNQEIRSLQPVGPYLLGGWSMGGLVAWEMAQQLVMEGETIGLLALIDTTPPPRYRETDDKADEMSMLARFAVDMSRLIGRDLGPLGKQFSQAAAEDQWKMVQETLTSYGVLTPKTARAEMTAMLDVFTRNFLALNNYSLSCSRQPVVFFRASGTPERFSKSWTTWAGGGIQFHLVPGDHFTMLRKPNVDIIAETLQRYISSNQSMAVPEMRLPA